MPVHIVKFTLLKTVNETHPQQKEVTVCQRTVVLDLAVVFVCDVFFKHLVDHHLRGICESRFIQKIEGAQG